MGGRTLGNENKYEIPTLTRNLKRRLFRRTAKMDRREVILWDNAWGDKKNTGTKSLDGRDQNNTKTS